MIGKKLKKNVITAPNVLYAKKIYIYIYIYPAYVSKNNSNGTKKVVLLMLPNGEGRLHYLAVKKLLALLRGIATKNKKQA